MFVRYLASLSLLLAALVTVGTLTTSNHRLLAISIVVIFAATAWFVSPLRSRGGLTHAEVQAMPADQRPVVIYWRPGSSTCMQLRSNLGQLRSKARWVNVWADPEARAFVRMINEGNETVPTVVLHGQTMTNPQPSMVKGALQRLE